MASLDTGVHVAEALDVMQRSLATMTTRQWTSPSLCADWDSQEVIAHVLWRLGEPLPRLARDLLDEAKRSRELRPHVCISHIARRRSLSEGPDGILVRLSRLAEEYRMHSRQTTHSALTEAIIHGYDAAQPRGIHLRFAAESTSAVARATARFSPLSVRAVLRRRRLVAVDDGWEVGNGADQIHGTAESIILYLNGRRSLIGPGELQTTASGPIAPSPGLA